MDAEPSESAPARAGSGSYADPHPPPCQSSSPRATTCVTPSARSADIDDLQLSRKSCATNLDLHRVAGLQDLEQLFVDISRCWMAFDIQSHHIGVWIGGGLRPGAA